MMAEMKVVLFDRAASDTSATRVGSLPRPTVEDGQVLIAVEFAGINFKDVMSRRGDTGYVDTWPFVPGLEVAGTVAAVGAGVRADLTPGARVVAVTNSGGLAEWASVDADLVELVPAEIDLAVAAGVPGTFGTAMLLVHEAARVRSGDAIVVHSASGAVGSAIAPLARLAGATTLIGVVGAESRLADAEGSGYDEVFVRGTGLLEELRAALPAGADIVLDSQGTVQLEDDLAVLRPFGRVVLFGNAGGGALGALPPTGRLYGANASVAGFSLAALSASEPARVRHAVAGVLTHVAAGRLQFEPTILDGLESAAEAQERLATGAGKGKSVIRVR